MDYLPLETKFGKFWVMFTSGDHAYVDANHGCLGDNPEAADGRHGPVKINSVAYGASAHFHKWADGSWHIGEESKTAWEQKFHSLYMSKSGIVKYNDSFASESARNKLYAELTTVFQAFVTANPEVIRQAAITNHQKEIANLEGAICQLEGTITATKCKIATAREKLAQLRKA